MFRKHVHGKISNEICHALMPSTSKYSLYSVSHINLHSLSKSALHGYSHSAFASSSAHTHRTSCACCLCHKSAFHSSPHLRDSDSDEGGQTQLDNDNDGDSEGQMDFQKEDPRSSEQVIAAYADAMDERSSKDAHTEEDRSSKIALIVAEISKLNLLEVAELVSVLKSTLNLPDTAMMGAGMPMAAAPAAGGGGEAAEAEPEITQTIFDVVLKSFVTEKKVAIIKEVRGIYKLGLKEAKALVEKAPCTLQAQAPKVEADEIKEKLEAIGAEIVLE